MSQLKKKVPKKKLRIRKKKLIHYYWATTLCDTEGESSSWDGVTCPKCLKDNPENLPKFEAFD